MAKVKRVAQERNDDILSQSSGIGVEAPAQMATEVTEPELPSEPHVPVKKEPLVEPPAPEPDLPESDEPELEPEDVPEDPDVPEARQGAGVDQAILPNEWLGIESAPRDGTQVEVATDVDGVPVTAFWRQTRQMQGFRWKKEGRWTNPLNNGNIDFFPTVWRPLSKNWGETVAAQMAPESSHGEAA